MSAPSNLGMVGTSLTSKARQVQREKENKEQWPYPYIYPPGSAIPVSAGLGPTVPGVTTAGIGLPAIGTQALVMQYQVPNGFTFWLRAVLTDLDQSDADPPSVIAPGDGSIFWTLDVDQAEGGTFPTGAPVKDFASVQVPLGSWTQGPFPLHMPLSFKARHILRWKISNVSLAVPASGTAWATAGLFGLLLPEYEG